MIRQYELVERVKAYDPNCDEDAVNRAYVYSMKAHGSQTRASGDPYFSHPIEVAGILTDYKLDWQTIVTALLHDTVEDTVATLDDIGVHFGNEIARLVDGVTKLSRIEIRSQETKQAENFQKLLLAMSDDIRVLLVKLADRLHNMRTLHFIAKPDKRTRIASETMEIFVPLAERIGMQEMKEELCELAFAELNPDARNSIVKRLEFLRAEGGAMVEEVTAELRGLLRENGIEPDINGREKRPYSIWNKMRRKNLTFERLSDIMAFRINVADAETCYRVLGVIHGRYRMVPGRFKDYLSTPKPNGYQSIHTTVLRPRAQRVEIQIRTHAMHEVAEKGVAAHWVYKQDPHKADTKTYRWLRELLEILDHAASPEEFLEHTKLEMYQDQVFCFTPKGDLINLPMGATAIDFAYAIHTGLGDSCIGCKINGRQRPLHTRLQTGDQVEMLRGKVPQPNPMWEHFVTTGKARSAIRRFIRKQEREQYEKLGREIVGRALKGAGLASADPDLTAAVPHINGHGAHHLRTTEDLYVAAGRGEVTGAMVLRALDPDRQVPDTQDNDTAVSLARVRAERARKSGDGAVQIKGLIPGMAVHFGKCCHPLPGERIVGIVHTGRGVTIHTVDCDQLETFLEQPDRWLDVSWDDAAETPHIVRLELSLENEPGALADVTTVLAQQRSNITNLQVTNRATDFFDMRIDLEVRDVRHLSDIMGALRSNRRITTVERARS